MAAWHPIRCALLITLPVLAGGCVGTNSHKVKVRRSHEDLQAEARVLDETELDRIEAKEKRKQARMISGDLRRSLTYDDLKRKQLRLLMEAIPNDPWEAEERERSAALDRDWKDGVRPMPTEAQLKADHIAWLKSIGEYVPPPVTVDPTKPKKKPKKDDEESEEDTEEEEE